MTTKLMTTSTSYAIEPTLSNGLEVSTVFWQAINRKTMAKTAVLSKEKAALDGKTNRYWSTERRLHSNRVVTAIETTLFKNGKQQGNGLIRNVALRGLFVETVVEFDEDALVQLRFCLPNEPDCAESYQLWGVVAHCSEKGIGLHADILHLDTDAALQALIKSTEG